MLKKIKNSKIAKKNLKTKKNKSLGHREFLRELKQSKPLASYSNSTKLYSCKFCSWQHYPWEFPRHLENAHANHLPPSANWRKDVIPDWNETFEQEYLANLLKPIIYEDPDLDKEDVSIKEIEKTAKETKRKDLEAKRDR
jgi:hypothetical protein